MPLPARLGCQPAFAAVGGIVETKGVAVALLELLGSQGRTPSGWTGEAGVPDDGRRY